MPPAKRAACSPSRVPRPPASTPTSSTCRYGTNAEKIPAAFEPPPTHATTIFGSERCCLRICSSASLPITDWNSRTITG